MTNSKSFIIAGLLAAGLAQQAFAGGVRDPGQSFIDRISAVQTVERQGGQSASRIDPKEYYGLYEGRSGAEPSDRFHRTQGLSFGEQAGVGGINRH